MLFLMFFGTFSMNLTYAHPGNTDESGGHTCYTNCGDWGLEYGEYHYHNSPSKNDDTGYNEGYDEGYSDFFYGADYKYEPIRDYVNDRYREGYEDGWSYGEYEYKVDGLGSNTGSVMYDEGFNDGYFIARKDYVYDDIIDFKNEEAKNLYQAGYHVGYLEGGGGSILEQVFYYLFQKSILITTTISIIFFITIILIFTKLKRKKSEDL